MVMSKIFNLRFFVVFVLSILSTSSNALPYFPLQYDETNMPVIRTPNGNYITSGRFVTNELSSQEKQSILNEMSSNYPNAIVLAAPTAKYNCHDYAWVKSEGGQECWLFDELTGATGIYKFWEDYSYVRTTSSYAEKIYYYAPNALNRHSAIKYDSLYYISKWAWGCLVKHEPTDVPDEYYTSDMRYYAKAPKTNSGPDILANTTVGTYSIACDPIDYTVTWQYNTSLLQQVGTPTSTSIKLKPKTSTTTGDAYVKAILTRTSDSFQITGNTHFIGVNGPHYANVSLTVTRSSDGALVYPNGIGVGPNKFYYATFQGIPSNYTISITSPQITVYSVNGNQVYFKVNDAGYALLTVNTTSPNGVTKYVMGATLYGGG